MPDHLKKNVWLNIIRLVAPYKKRLSTIFLISLLATTVTLVEPLIYREAINDISGLFVHQARTDVRKEIGYETGEHPARAADRHKKIEKHTPTHVAPRTVDQAFDTLLWAVIALFAINVAGLLLWWIGENMNVKLSCTIEQKFIKRTFGHVLKLPLSFFVKRSSAALHKQIDQSEEISGTVSHITKDIFPEIVSLVGIVGIMLWQNYILALLALSVIPFYILLTIRSSKKLEWSLSGYYEKWEDVSATMQGALGGIKTVKLSGAEDREVEHLDQQSEAAYKDYIKRSFLSNKYSFWQILLTHLATAMVLSYGGYLALNHHLTPGDVVMFVAYLDMLYSPIDNLAGIWAEIQQNITSIARAFKLLDTEPIEKAGEELRITKGRVEFRNVVFGYTPERNVLNQLSFVAEPGEMTAIVGTSGAGKTTTVDLLLKLFQPQQGAILVDGQDLDAVAGSSARQHIGMVSADGSIFRGTLADNIRYKNPKASDKEVNDAAAAAGMNLTLQRLPEGLQTIVGEGGFGLSVGERQRLQIARIIVSRPKILVMDEATANLDYATEAEVKRTIETIRKENTVIVIAHRFSMVRNADHVIVLDGGQVVEEGTPQQLIDAGGWFSHFANAADEEDERLMDEEEPEDLEDPEEEENE